MVRINPSIFIRIECRHLGTGETGLMQIEEAGASLSQDSAEADDEDPAEKTASSADDSAETR